VKKKVKATRPGVSAFDLGIGNLDRQREVVRHRQSNRSADALEGPSPRQDVVDLLGRP
jgi:hypothetical protein